MKKKLFFISMFWISMMCFSQNTYVPDDNFENYLETHNASGKYVGFGNSSSMGNGIADDDTVLTANINTVTKLSIIAYEISDVTGIEDFTALTSFFCTLNDNITTLDVSKNTLLTDLRFSKNKISTIDLSQNTALSWLVCGRNNLSTLDVSKNTALTYLDCNRNNLSSLNVKNGNNTNFIHFSAGGNYDLKCIEVDDATWSTNTWPNYVDDGTSFSEDCVAFLSTDDFALSGFNMYPNPAKDLLTISLNKDANYSLMNLNGQVFKTGNITYKENTIDVTNLSSGIYFIKVKTDEGVATKKLIKQ